MFVKPNLTIETIMVEDIITTSGEVCDTHCAANDCSTEGGEF